MGHVLSLESFADARCYTLGWPRVKGAFVLALTGARCGVYYDATSSGHHHEEP